MSVEILNIGVTPACLKCGHVMSALEPMQIGDKRVTVQCLTPECLDHKVKYRITLPVVIGEKVE